MGLNRTLCTSCNRPMGSSTERLKPKKKASPETNTDSGKSSFEDAVLNDMPITKILALLALLYIALNFGKDFFWFFAGDRPVLLGGVLLILLYGFIRAYLLFRKWYNESNEN